MTELPSTPKDVACPHAPEPAQPVQFTLRRLLLLMALMCLVLAIGRQWGFEMEYLLTLVVFVTWAGLFGRTWPEILTVVAVLFFVTAMVQPVVFMPNPRAQQFACRNNLQQIGMALLTYESEYGSLPPANTTDATGRRLHSWRSHILPQISRQRLYDAIDFSQPWNSPTNRLPSVTLPMFQCVSSGAGAQVPYTSYVAVSGPETMWPDGQCRCTKDVTDGLENTILLVETPRTDIAWAEPRDLTLKEVLHSFRAGDERGVGSRHLGGGFHVVFADGSMRYIDLSKIDEATLRALFTVAGGEEVELDDL